MYKEVWGGTDGYKTQFTGVLIYGNTSWETTEDI
jgi:hypothetical protein